MSSVAIVKQADAIHLITDAATYDRDGILTGICSKVLLLPEVPAAIAVRGNGQALTHIMSALHLRPLLFSFDSVIAALPVLTSMAKRVALETRYEFPDFELLLVGWSAKRDRPETWYIATKTNVVKGFEAYRAYKIPDDLIVGPLIDKATFIWFHSSDRRSFPDDAVRIINSQRLYKGSLHGPNTYEGHGVGGFAQLTTIDPSGLSSHVIHQWPDKIGERIDPTAEFPTVEERAA